MNKKPIVVSLIISLVLALSIITMAWVIQDAKVSSIKFRSVDDGVTVMIRPGDGGAFTQEMSFASDEINLKPCVLRDDGYFYNEKGQNVTNNNLYVKEIEIFVKPEKSANIYATATTSGVLPMVIRSGNTEVTENTLLGNISGNGQMVTFTFYIDGNQYEQSGTATTEITLRGN